MDRMQRRKASFAEKNRLGGAISSHAYHKTGIFHKGGCVKKLFYTYKLYSDADSRRD